MARPVLLIVDDEASILSALGRCLRREGWTLLTASSVAEARKVLAGQRVDAVLSDQKMPGGSGLELLGEVARSRPETARLLLTGWPEEVPKRELQRLGIAALIPKPWDDGVLKTALRAVRPPG